MENTDDVPFEAKDFYKSIMIMSPEIVEIVDECAAAGHGRISRERPVSASSFDDVYVAVGRDDVNVLKWAIDHVVSPGARVYLVHIYPPITYIPTPVGKLSRSQLTQDQVRFYDDEEENRRKNLLQKYIRLCNDAKVKVDTVMIEHTSTAKAIVDLIPFHNITNLVIGMKKLPSSRILRTRISKAEYVKKSAPAFCEVSIVHDGEEYIQVDKATGLVHSTNSKGSSQRHLFPFSCFLGKS